MESIKGREPDETYKHLKSSDKTKKRSQKTFSNSKFCFIWFCDLTLMWNNNIRPARSHMTLCWRTSKRLQNKWFRLLIKVQLWSPHTKKERNALVFSFCFLDRTVNQFFFHAITYAATIACRCHLRRWYKTWKLTFCVHTFDLFVYSVGQFNLLSESLCNALSQPDQMCRINQFICCGRAYIYLYTPVRRA